MTLVPPQVLPGPAEMCITASAPTSTPHMPLHPFVPSAVCYQTERTQYIKAWYHPPVPGIHQSIKMDPMGKG